MVQRLAALHEHVVADVDDIVDGGQADCFEPASHPLGARADLHTADHPGRYNAGTGRGQSDPHLDQPVDGRLLVFFWTGERDCQFMAEQDSRFAGDADVAQAVGPGCS